MIYRKLVVVLVLFISLSTGFSQSTPVLRFGLIADVQYCDCDTNGTRFYRNSLSKLESAVADLNNQQVEFTINLGDLVDRNPEDLDAVVSRQKLLDSKVYTTLGNHDYEGVDNNKKLYRKLGLRNDYYSFEKRGWRFIVLNTNEVASYSNIGGTSKEQELAIMLDNIRERNGKNGKTWNGGISSRQMEWLKKLLQNADKNNEKVLIFSHHPLYPAEGYTALNDVEILETISLFSNVRGVISGHHHVGAYGVYKGIPFITIEGMVETEKENAYAVVNIYEDKLVITGKSRAKSYEFDLKP